MIGGLAKHGSLSLTWITFDKSGGCPIQVTLRTGTENDEIREFENDAVKPPAGVGKPGLLQHNGPGYDSENSDNAEWNPGMDKENTDSSSQSQGEQVPVKRRKKSRRHKNQKNKQNQETEKEQGVAMEQEPEKNQEAAKEQGAAMEQDQDQVKGTENEEGAEMEQDQGQVNRTENEEEEQKTMRMTPDNEKEEKKKKKKNEKKKKGSPGRRKKKFAGSPRSSICEHKKGCVRLSQWSQSGAGSVAFCSLCHVCDYNFVYTLSTL